jgi:hypothetical protein
MKATPSAVAHSTLLEPGFGVPCPDVQGDGTPCPDCHTECCDCETAKARKGASQPPTPTETTHA